MSDKPVLKKATMELAKAAWQAHPKPSIRKVIAALEQQGYKCSVATLQRWKEKDFVGKEIPNSEPLTPEEVEQTTKAVGAAVGEYDGKQADEAAIASARAEELAKIVHVSELAEIDAKKSLIARIILSEQIIRRAVDLVRLAPAVASDVIEVLKKPSSATVIIPPDKAPAMANGDDARVINGHAVERSSTALAIESFLAREGAAA